MIFLEVREIDLDLDPHVDFSESDQLYQAAKTVGGIGSTIYAHDVAATAPQELVDPQVLEVSTVGDVHMRAAHVEPTDRFPQEVHRGPGPRRKTSSWLSLECCRTTAGCGSQ